MKKIVFFNKTLLSGGIEKCIETLSRYLYKDYELEICFYDDSKLDMNIVNILSKYAKITKLEENTVVDCDICIWCYLYFDYQKMKSLINAKEYICWIHSMPRILPDCLLDDEMFVSDCSRFICVSEAVKTNLNISKEGEVIHNFINDNIKELSMESNPLENDMDKLKLCVVSRLSNGKGFDRLLKLVESLEKNNTNYILNIIGKGRTKEDEIKEWCSPYSNVHFIGYRDNPYNYVKNSDYLIQLSDDESWCNSITEAKALGVPVVVTNFLSAKEQVLDGYNGLLVDLNCEDYDTIVSKMIEFNTVLKDNLKDFVYEAEINKWIDILK